MKCTDRCIRLTAGIIILTLSLTGCSLLGHKEAVAEYETEHYNKNIYQAGLFADDLCVVSQDIPLDNAPDSAGLHAAALFDVDAHKTDYAYQVHDRLYPASTTKIMTALVAIKNADLSSVVTVNADAVNFAPDEQTCGLKAGDQLTLEALLYGLLLYSGNDNAVAIAEYVGGSIDGFADMMNAEAEALMATETHFINPNGLHSEDHYTTAYDLYLIFNECIKQEAFVNMISVASYTAEITGADGSIRQQIWKPTSFYALGETALPEKTTIVGGKTGTTKPAGNCLILLNKAEGDKPYISIVMGADTKPLLYQDMTALINAIPNTE